jgi:hypothetical protein
MGEAGVEAVEGEQLVMGAAFDDFAVAQDEDEVGVADGAEAMGDDEAGAAGHEPVQGLLDETFGRGVDAGGGFVEDQDRAVFEERAGDADALFFADAEFDAAFADE